MKKRIVSYRRRIDGTLASGQCGDWRLLLAEHRDQIAFFQHERLVHLLVTLLFAVCCVGAAAASALTGSLHLIILTALLLVLLIPYIFHYYTLENEVQRMYSQYDRIIEHIREVNASGTGE